MTEDIALLEKHQELKVQLTASEHRTLNDVVLDGTGGLLHKLTPSREPVPYWVSAVLIALITLLIGTTISLVFGELDPDRREDMLIAVAIVVFALASMVLARIAQGILLSTLRDHLVDAIELRADSADLQRWLAARYAMRKQLLFCIAWSLLMTSYVTASTAANEGRIPAFGMLFLTVTTTFLGGPLLYLFFLVVSFCARLSHYQLKLYTTDPASSGIIHHLSSMIGNEAFIGAALSALYTLFWASSSHFDWTVIIALVAMGWGPPIAIFVTGQRALTRIIGGGKWRTLDGIQARIDALATKGDLTDRETTDAMNRLMDLHDRIKGTRNSALDFRAGLGFLNSLLLPLIAFVLANLEPILGLFR